MSVTDMSNKHAFLLKQRRNIDVELEKLAQLLKKAGASKPKMAKSGVKSTAAGRKRVFIGLSDATMRYLGKTKGAKVTKIHEHVAKTLKVPASPALRRSLEATLSSKKKLKLVKHDPVKHTWTVA